MVLPRRLGLALAVLLSIATASAQHSLLKQFYRVTPTQVAPGANMAFHVQATPASFPVQRVSVTVSSPTGAPVFATAGSDGSTTGFSDGVAYGFTLNYKFAPGHYKVTEVQVTDNAGTTSFHRDGTVTYGTAGLATHTFDFADADFDVVAPATMTLVSGLITHDTTWTTAGSPYVLTDKLIVPVGVTLTIAEGVIVVGDNDFPAAPLEVSGHVIIAGTATNPVRLEGLTLTSGHGSVGEPSLTDISHAVVLRGGVWPENALFDYGGLNIRDSYLADLENSIGVSYPAADCTFERNVFVSSSGFYIGVGNGHAVTVTIKNNVFYHPLLSYNELDDYTSTGAIVCWANDGGRINANYNSFYGVHWYTRAYVLKLPRLGLPSSDFDATNNYWDTLTATDVSRLILDSTVSTDYHHVIPYLPVLTAPDPKTPPLPDAPTITTQPTPKLLSPGDSTTLSIAAATTLETAYQWKKDGVAIAGATGSTLTLTNFSAAQAGNYTVTLTNGWGTVTSSEVSASALTSWLTNVSVRAALQPGQPLIVGLTTNRAKSILMRAAGPALRNFAISGNTANPALKYFPSGATAPTIVNDDWDSSLSATFDATGAFGLAGGSKDSALIVTLPPGIYSAQVSSGDGTTGAALVEVYEAP